MSVECIKKSRAKYVTRFEEKTQEKQSQFKKSPKTIQAIITLMRKPKEGKKTLD